MVWLDAYEAVRFGGKELSEREFLDTMKLVHYLLMEMKPPERFENEYALQSSSETSSSDASSSFLMDSMSVGSDRDRGTEVFEDPPARVETNRTGGTERDAEGLKQMQPLFSVGRRSVDSMSLGGGSMIDYGSDVIQDEIDQEDRNRRMRGGRLGRRKGSVIYYDE